LFEYHSHVANVASDTLPDVYIYISLKKKEKKNGKQKKNEKKSYIIFPVFMTLAADFY